MRLIRTPTPPVIDGVLDDGAWQNAAFIDNLHQVNPVEYAEPSEPTEIYLLCYDDALYIGARLYASDPSEVTANVLRQSEYHRRGHTVRHAGPGLYSPAAPRAPIPRLRPTSLDPAPLSPANERIAFPGTHVPVLAENGHDVVFFSYEGMDKTDPLETDQVIRR